MKPSNFVVIKKVAWSSFDCSEFYKIASEASQIFTVQRYLFEISRQKLTFNGYQKYYFWGETSNETLFVIYFKNYNSFTSKMSRKNDTVFWCIIFDKNIQEECTNRYSTTRVLLLCWWWMIIFQAQNNFKKWDNGIKITISFQFYNFFLKWLFFSFLASSTPCFCRSPN